jgi:DNA-binding transcriptional regulator GbsR (MarR family)
VRDEAAVTQFVERFATVFVDAGMPRIASRIFVSLLATDDGRLTAAELSERLQASPAAISGGVRYLIHVEMISRERDPGSRRDHYRVADDVWHETFTQRDALIARWITTMSEGIDALGPDTPAGSRMAQSVEFFAFMQKELEGMLDRWREYRSQRG